MPNNPWTGPLPFQPASQYRPAPGGGIPHDSNGNLPGSLPWSATQARPQQPAYGMNDFLRQQYGTLTPNPPPSSVAPPTAGPTAPGPSTNTPAGPPLNLSGIPPMYLPTKQSQNMLMAKAAQQASPGNAINRLVGNTGIQSSSGTILSQMAKPMLDAYRQGAQGAANLGIDDQLLRDQNLMRGVLGHGQADIGALRALGNRERIGIEGQNQLGNSLTNLLRSLGGMFNTNNLLGSASDIGGLF